MADRVALYLQDAHDIRESIDYVLYAEQQGFEAVWQAESRLGRDAIVPMAAFATATRKIKIGSGVVNNWTRNAALTAATFLTLDELAPDRIILGIGAWWDPLAAKVGIDRRKPLLAMREHVDVVRNLLAMKTVTFHGEFVNVEAITLDAGHGRNEPRKIPIMIGATGPKMLKLTGEIGDGVVLNYLVSPAYNDRAMEQIQAGANLAGRSIDDIDRPQLVVCSVERDRNKALNRARKLVTQYLAQQPQIMRASGVSQELLDDVHHVLNGQSTDADIEKAMALVPDDVVTMVTAAGTPEDCRAKVREYVEHGATCPILYPLGDDVKLMIDTFSNGYSV